VHPVLVSLTAAALGFAPANHVSHLHRAAAAPAKHAVAAAKPAANVRLSAMESDLLDQINGVRARHGLRPFRLSAGLTAAATQHSESMAQKGYFSHDSANGGVFWRRIASFYGYRGYRNWSVGENILWSSPDIDAGGSLKMWMGSPEHRANLLDRQWREIGLSAVHVAGAPGVYGGAAVTIVTADFGIRS
jgi:uncharacterized protein YkwD